MMHVMPISQNKFDPYIVSLPVISMTKGWFERAVSNPAEKNITTQIGVHFEEVAEMIAEITPLDLETGNALQDALVAVKHLGEHLKRHGGIEIKPENRIGFIDAIADQLVTATGSAHMLGMDPVGALNEVNRSNFSKFDENGNPIFNENMKVIKGPNYSKPDLTLFV